ncbi:hypothetical protein ACOME3_010477 [Neoechinorhynchus agilis]
MSCCDRDDRWWAQNPHTLPIYIYNKINGNGRNSGAINFLGSLSSYWGHSMTDVNSYDSKLEWEHIVNNITLMFLRRENPINLGLIYKNEPDSTGHRFGPESREMGDTLMKVNSYLEYLISHLQSVDLWNDMNVIVTTDHGMTDTHKSDALVLENYIDLASINLTNALTIAHIFTKTSQEAIAVKNKLSNIPNFGVYLREEVPEVLEFSRNIRIGDVVILPNKGYLIFQDQASLESNTMRGSHGYDNNDEDMHGIFIARGPAINKGASVEGGIINLHDVYPFMTHVLRLPQRQTDGQFDKVKALLKF